MSVHFKPLLWQVQWGNLHERTQWQESSYRTASGAGEHPLNDQLAILICCPTAVLGVWNRGLTLQTFPPNGSLIVGTEDMHEKTVLTWGELTRLHFSTSGTEQLVRSWFTSVVLVEGRYI